MRGKEEVAHRNACHYWRWPPSCQFRNCRSSLATVWESKSDSPRNELPPGLILKSRVQYGVCWIFTLHGYCFGFESWCDFIHELSGNPRLVRVSRKTNRQAAPFLRQGAVNGVHSLENPRTYKRVFFIDEKNRRSTTRSFFDSFLSFSGWCGVRGSSRVTVETERFRWRAGKGL